MKKYYAYFHKNYIKGGRLRPNSNFGYIFHSSIGECIKYLLNLTFSAEFLNQIEIVEVEFTDKNQQQFHIKNTVMDSDTIIKYSILK